MPRGFTESEKEKIRENLIGACQKRWSRYGYKKTSVEELCRKAGISKGAFYLFFESKEALFCEALCRMQEEIRDGASRIIDERPDHFGVSEAIKFVYRAYDENNFLRDSDSADFAALMDKLPEAQRRRLMRSEEKNRNLFLEKSCLRLKVDENLAVSVIYSLIMNGKNKDALLQDHRSVLDFMTDHLIRAIYE